MFLISEKMVFIDYNESYCTTSIQILNSKQFKKVLSFYINYLNRKNYLWWSQLKKVISPGVKIQDELLILFKLLLVFKKEEIVNPLLTCDNELYRFVNEFYDYWRLLERYATIMFSPGQEKGITTVNFIDSYNNFNQVVLLTYRRISERILGHKNLVYRQLAAGCDCGMMLKEINLSLPNEYSHLQKIPLITTVVFSPPFIAYTKSSTRDGVFKEITFNPIEGVDFIKNQWFCFPLKVGDYLALVYFHKDYTNIGISLANLFEVARIDETQTIKPDIIYVHGGNNPKLTESCFYHDLKQNLYIGFTPYNDESTYFGYMKKMLLTLHNVKKLDEEALPLHGAMMSIEFQNNQVKNLIIIGDSGAGKSETIEAMRLIAKDEIKAINIVFDDMGSIKVVNNRILAYGSEIGAFVRLDDLDTGYAYKKLDRAIFLNPDKKNARAIIPTSLYEDIIKGHGIDLFLYANNYDDQEGLIFFNDIQQAKDIFKEGKRKALATTSEKGIVTTFFANPFGPLQRQEQTNILIDKYFNFFFTHSIPVGMIYTQLGIENKKSEGIKKAANALLEYLKKL